ncbi:ATP-binding protein [Micromonospora echinaurantiaca]|uniref:ATP-binding protein n=1 Tax=Micromonospora echinaurantiaca TaxID=47857 RepID=UPI00344A1402
MGAASAGGTGRRVVAPALVGRVGELAALTAAVSAPPSVVTVAGEAGVGKTRLVSELLGLPELTGRRVLVGRCHPIREAFPLGPIVEALAGVGDQVHGLGLSEVAGAVRPLLPELAPWLPPAPEPLDDRASQRHRVFRGLVDVLGALSPVVLVMEDLHWVDEQTSDFLAYLLAVSPPGLTAVVTYRGEQAGPHLRAVPATLPAGITRAHVALAPLSEAETGALAAGILGTEGVSQQFARHLWERTSGLPFAVEEVLALVRERGLLVQRGDRWARRALDRLEVPRGIRESTLERVLRLSTGARRTAEAAAVLQAPVGLPVLAAMTGGEGLVEALEEAIGHGVLVETDGAFGFRHALAAQAVYESLSTPRRTALHGRAARALEALSPPPLGRIAHHQRQADELAPWAVTAEAAADQAVQLADDAEAVRLLADVLRHAPLDARQRGRIAVKLGWAAIHALRAEEALELLPAAIGEDLPPAVRGEIRLLVSLLLNETGGDPQTERRLLVDAAADLDDRPDLQALTMVALGVPSTPGVPIAEHLMWTARALALTTEVDRLVEAHVLGKAGMVLVSVGDPSWRDLADRLQGLTAGTPRQRREANAYLSIGWEACLAGHLDIAGSLLAAGLRSAAAQENRRLELGFRSAQVFLAFCRGQWDGLAQEVALLVEQLSDYPRFRIDVDVVAGCLALAHGEVDQARQRLADASQLAERLGDLPVLPVAVDAATRAALSQGDVEAAVAGVRRCRSLLTAKDTPVPLARLLPAAVEALVAAGERDEADDLVRLVAEELCDRDVPLLPAALHYARGILAADGDALLLAAEEYRRVGAGHEAVRARERAAGLLLHAGDERGTPLLRDAVRAYEALGATWDLNRALGLARRYGVGLPARHRGGRRGYGAALSPREQQVAELAATGRTNKEIAEALVLSATTVEKHLGAVMRKLSIRSRTELARLMAIGTGKDGGFPS